MSRAPADLDVELEGRGVRRLERTHAGVLTPEEFAHQERRLLGR